MMPDGAMPDGPEPLELILYAVAYDRTAARLRAGWHPDAARLAIALDAVDDHSEAIARRGAEDAIAGMPAAPPE